MHTLLQSVALALTRRFDLQSTFTFIFFYCLRAIIHGEMISTVFIENLAEKKYFFYRMKLLSKDIIDIIK